MNVAPVANVARVVELPQITCSFCKSNRTASSIDNDYLWDAAIRPY